jgi:hypothetical protein
MMISILAAGYLLSVYLLLALAKRTGKKTPLKAVLSVNNSTLKQEEVVNSQ